MPCNELKARIQILTEGHLGDPLKVITRSTKHENSLRWNGKFLGVTHTVSVFTLKVLTVSCKFVVPRRCISDDTPSTETVLYWLLGLREGFLNLAMVRERLARSSYRRGSSFRSSKYYDVLRSESFREVSLENFFLCILTACVGK